MQEQWKRASKNPCCYISAPGCELAWWQKMEDKEHEVEFPTRCLEMGDTCLKLTDRKCNMAVCYYIEITETHTVKIC